MKEFLVMDRIESSHVRLKLSKTHEIVGKTARNEKKNRAKATWRFWMIFWKKRLRQKNSAA